MLCLHYEDVSQTAPAAVKPMLRLRGMLKLRTNGWRGAGSSKGVNSLTPVTLRHVGQMLSVHDSQQKI